MMNSQSECFLLLLGKSKKYPAGVETDNLRQYRQTDLTGQNCLFTSVFEVEREKNSNPSRQMSYTDGLMSAHKSGLCERVKYGLAIQGFDLNNRLSKSLFSMVYSTRE